MTRSPSREWGDVAAPESALEYQPLPGSARTYEIITAIYGRVLAASALVALSPLWLAVGLAIKLTSAGPVLFRAPVVGLNGRVFEYWKFRTMRAANDDSHHARWIEAFVRSDQPYTTDSNDRPVYKVTDDPRITGVGRWLRRLSLDEVPQLLNVLRGDMNIVGPRPPVLYEYQLYGPEERRRLAVKPGITGLCQVRVRGRASFSEMLRLDLEYIGRRSLWLDLQILLRTPLVLLKAREVA